MISAEIIKLSRRTLARVFKTPVREEVEEELDFHIEKRTREYQAMGMSRDEARRVAEARFGDLPQVISDLEGLGKRRDEVLARQEGWGTASGTSGTHFVSSGDRPDSRGWRY